MKIFIYHKSWLQLIATTVDDALEFLCNTKNPADYRVVYWTPYRRKVRGNEFLESFDPGVQYGRSKNRAI